MLDIKNQRNNYSDSEVMKMQREAINRVKEMQRLAKKNIVKTNNCNIINKISSKEIDQKERLEHKEKPYQNHSKVSSNNTLRKSSFLEGLLDKKNIKNDNILIMAVLFFLTTEEYEDKVILIALLYILLDI